MKLFSAMKLFFSPLCIFWQIIALCSFFLLPLTKTFASSLNLYEANNIDLSNKAVLCMYQDKNGYLWIGTYDGLNLYNSKNVFVYRFDLQIEKSLCSNIIHKITPAGNDHLWISTFLGLNKFSITDRTVTESYPECPEAKLLACDKKGNTCVILNDGSVNYYTPAQKKFNKFSIKGIRKNEVKALFTNGDNTFFILTASGDLTQLLFSSTNEGPKVNVIRKPFHKYNILYAFSDHLNLYWIDTNGWLFRHNPEDKQTVFIKDIKDIISHYGEIAQITSFQNDIYLAFKSNGVLRLVRNHQYQPEEVNLKIGVFSLLRDKRQDILWIGTDGQGVQMYYDKPDQFHNFTFNHLPFNLQKPVRAIYTESNNLWIGTKGGGVVLIKDFKNRNNKKLSSKEVRSFTTNNGLTNNQVFSLHKSRYKNILWIGTEGPGLSCFSFDKDRIIIPSGPENKKIEKVHSICETDDSTLWIATAGSGIQKVKYRQSNKDNIEIQSVKIFTFEKNGRVSNEFHSLRYIGNSTLLIGSRGGYGLIKFNILTYKYSFIPMNSSEYSAIGDVLSVHQSKDSVFYIGASSGLTKMQLLPDNKTHLIKQFDRRGGLANDMIHGILEDNDGCIWLSTNKGLAKYNPRNDYFHTYMQDLEVTEFSDDAYWQSPSTKRLFFGGVNGIVWFDPQTEERREYKTNLSFFDLKFSGESVHWSDYYNATMQQIEIPPEVKTFSVSFVAVDNYSADNYEYSYLLEGYSSNWTKLQKNNEVIFSNLPIGEYTLNVKYNNDVFNAKDNNYALNICVLPPWYLTRHMIVVYIFLFLLLVTFVIIKIKKQIQKKHLSFAKRIEEEQREKLLETKLNFFTNITHELCTPLTLINGITDQISRESENNRRLTKYTSVLNNNVNSLNELIQEILDFRKIEDSEFGLCQIEKTSITKLVNNISASFAPLSAQNNIDFSVSVSDHLFWDTDSAFLKKILTNLISNAFKYCNKAGKIDVKGYVEDHQLILKVYNTGPGIEASEIPHIFNRFRISNILEKDTNIQNASRTGLGLSICKSLVNALKGKIDVKSRVGEFAEFIITLPGKKEVSKNSLSSVKQKKRIPDKNKLDKISSLPKILVVDDNKDITWLISQTLSSEYNILESTSAKEALELIKESTPDLIITDIIMPGISGLEFTREIKTGIFTKHIPVIIISAKVTHIEQAEGFNIGADAYLTKPFSPHLLTSVVHRLLENKQEMRHYYQSSESVYEISEGQLIHTEDKELMKRVINIVKENIDSEELRPGFIAEQLGMNIRSFYRHFKNISTLAPSDYIKEYRLNFAAKMLLTTKLTVQEIIYKTGISNKSYFYREFSKKFNMTPKEYREQK